MSQLYDHTFDLLEKTLDLRMKRHAVLSTNVANSDTPKFRAIDFDFNGELERAMKQGASDLGVTNPRHLNLESNSDSRIIYDYSMPMGADGNNVDPDMALGKLAQNTQAFNNAAEYMFIKIRLLRFAARGGQGGM